MQSGKNIYLKLKWKKEEWFIFTCLLETFFLTGCCNWADKLESYVWLAIRGKGTIDMENLVVLLRSISCLTENKSRMMFKERICSFQMTSKQGNGLSSTRVQGLSLVNTTHLECPICHELLWKPVACHTCEKPFCSACICQWLSNHPNQCPNQCPTYVERKCPPLCASLLAELQISCFYLSQGCEQVILHWFCRFRERLYFSISLGLLLRSVGPARGELWLWASTMFWLSIRNIKERSNQPWESVWLDWTVVSRLQTCLQTTRCCDQTYRDSLLKGAATASATGFGSTRTNDARARYSIGGDTIDEWARSTALLKQRENICPCRCSKEETNDRLQWFTRCNYGNKANADNLSRNAMDWSAL